MATAGTEKKNNIKKRLPSITNIDFELRSPLLRRILLIALIAIGVVFVIYQAASFGRSRVASLNTQTALSRTITKSINTEGVVLREESILSSAVNGTVVPRVENGSKVSAGDPVAEIFAAQRDAQYLLELDEVNARISHYESIQLLNSGNIYENKDTYNQNISQTLFSLIGCIDRNELSELSEAVEALSVSVTKKQIVIGTPVNVDVRLEGLYQRRTTLESYISQGTALLADRAGYYVDQADGYEDMADYSAVLTSTPEDVAALLSAQPGPVSRNFGKLITQFNWYLLCAVSRESAESLKVGQKVNISMSGYSGGTIRMQLVAMNEGGDGQIALVFRSNLMNAEIASLRMEDVKICLEEYTGYPVDRTALRTVDGEVGVYVQVGNIVRFRKVEIIYSDDSIVIASPGGGSGYLKRYDEIITEGTDLYDGKIID